MKKLVFATVLAMLGSASAVAADLGAPSYSKAPPMAPISAWQGLYIGGNLGYGWGNGNTAFNFLPDPVSFGVANTALDPRAKGVLGGGQIGYNWQIGALVTGIEADIQGSGIKGSATRSPIVFNDGTPSVPGSFLSTDQKLSWFGTVRGRLGVAVVPDVLLFGTAGLAYGHIDTSANTFFSNTGESFLASVSKTKAGWTAGGGVEWMFAHNWSAKFEYLFVDLGSVSAIANDSQGTPFAVGYTGKTQENIVRAGVNYHF